MFAQKSIRFLNGNMISGVRQYFDGKLNIFGWKGIEREAEFHLVLVRSEVENTLTQILLKIKVVSPLTVL